MNRRDAVIIGLAALVAGGAWYLSTRGAGAPSGQKRLAELQAKYDRGEGLTYSEYQEYQALTA